MTADFGEDGLGADDLALSPPDGDTDADVQHGEESDGEEEEAEEEEVVDSRVDGAPHRVFRGAVTRRKHSLAPAPSAMTRIGPAQSEAVAMATRRVRLVRHVQEEGLAAEEEAGGPGG